MKIRNWFKSLSTQEKMMMLFIVLLIVAIISRWSFIKSEVTESFINRFNPDRHQTEEVKDQ